MSESYITVRPNGELSSVVGPDATRWFRARLIRGSIELHKKTGMIPTRGVTITKLFAMAGELSGRRYKRGEHDRAVRDLTVWIETMTSALPIIKT